MLEQLNKFINDLLGKFGTKPEYEEVGENLIKEDFSNRGIINSENLAEHIKLPSPEISDMAKGEDKVHAHEKFLNSNHLEPQANVAINASVPEVAPSITTPVTAPVQTQVAPTSTAGHILRGVAYTFAALCLLGISYIVFTYATKYVDSKVAVTQSNFVFDNPLVRADNTRTMSVEAGVDRSVIKNNILQTMNNEQVAVGKVTIIVPSFLRESMQNNKKVYVSEVMRADDFLFTFAPSAPLAFRTAASGEYALGLVNSSGKAEGFVALSMNEKVAGIREFLRYEQFVLNDLKDVFNIRAFSGEARWRDITVNNHDLRVLSDDVGVLLVYGFATTKTVVIAPNTETFEKISQRLK